MNILYVHGMGGGGDSRIPRLLNEYFQDKEFGGEKVNVVARTYDFDPEIGRVQLLGWFEELKPALVIGESLGAIQAIRLRGVPHILVSPSLGAPDNLYGRAWAVSIPGIQLYLHLKFRVKKGDRQKLKFRRRILLKYKAHWEDALKNMPANGSKDYFYAFFGTQDHYMKQGIVRIDMYEKYFGKSYTVYEGSHFMEEPHIYNLLIPKILEVLNLCSKTE